MQRRFPQTIQSQLTHQERKNPTVVFEAFFDHYRLQLAQKELQDLVQIGLVTDNEIYNTGTKRDNLLYLQKNLLRLMEAAFIQSSNTF
jgi:hypothetical protein